MRILRGLVRVCTAMGALAALGSLLGAVHPLGDSLAVMRPWIAGGLTVCVVAALSVAQSRWAGLAAVLAGLCVVLSAPLPWRAVTADQFAVPQSVYQKNLLFRLSDPSRILADIAALDPDHITLQEVSAGNRAAVYDVLAARYEHQYCTFPVVGGVAVLSRYPVIEGTRICVDGEGLAGFQVDAPGGPLWVVSIHLRWPYPYYQRDQIELLLPVIEALDGPVLIGGDFNMVRATWVTRAFERTSGSNLAAPLAGTIQLFDGWFAPAIDHVFLPNTGGIHSVRPRNNSDHRSVFALFEGAP